MGLCSQRFLHTTKVLEFMAKNRIIPDYMDPVCPACSHLLCGLATEKDRSKATSFFDIRKAWTGPQTQYAWRPSQDPVGGRKPEGVKSASPSGITCCRCCIRPYQVQADNQRRGIKHFNIFLRTGKRLCSPFTQAFAVQTRTRQRKHIRRIAPCTLSKFLHM